MQYLEFSWITSTAIKKIEALQNIIELQVATAFIEQAGVDWIEKMATTHSLTRDRVKVFLSVSFSTNQPAELLEHLNKIAIVYIVFQQKLHAKAIWVYDKSGEGKVMMGSANMTNMGLYHNLELTGVFDVQVSGATSTSNIKYFFERLKDLSRLVDHDLIELYREREKSLQEVAALQRSAEKITQSIFTHDDPVLPSQEELSSFFFTFDDYETLFPRNASLNAAEIRVRRQKLKDKLIELHESIEPIANRQNLFAHWDRNHITSLIIPSVFNYGMVNWLAIRYGKSRSQIEKLNPGATREEDNMYSFPKHGCIQMSMGDRGFSIALFHAVKHNAWDRAYMANRLSKDSKYMNDVVSSLEQLIGYGYVWYFHDPFTGHGASFSLDDEDLEDFPSFYSRDQDGYESYLICTYEPDDPAIETKEDIVALVQHHITMLKPIYDKMVQV